MWDQVCLHELYILWNVEVVGAIHQSYSTRSGRHLMECILGRVMACFIDLCVPSAVCVVVLQTRRQPTSRLRHRDQSTRGIHSETDRQTEGETVTGTG